MIHGWIMKEKKEKDDYVTVRIPKDLSDLMDLLLGTYGFRSKAEITKEALRHLLLDYVNLPHLQHYNLGDDGVKVVDKKLNRIVDVFFKPEGIQCGFCGTGDCDHVKFVLGVPSVQVVIRQKRKEGWDLPEV